MLFEAKAYDRSIVSDDSFPAVSGDGFRIFFDGCNDPRIEAATLDGARYAIEYWEEVDAAGAVPDSPVILEDSPRFEERGFMLDISRDRVPTMGFLREFVTKLSRLRYNQLQLYTEHTFAFRNHPRVWEDASPFTPAEIEELEDFCLERGVELVPNQNCFGHMERWLRLPKYRHLAECPDGFEHPIAGRKEWGTTLYPSPDSESLVREMLSEVLPLFQSPKANIGGDEPWELGQGRSRSAVEASGKHEVYLAFMEKIFAITGGLGKEPIFWADIILERPELVPRLPKNAVPAIWGYHPSHPYSDQCRTIADAGFRHQFQVVPGTNTWNSFAGRLDFALENIRIAAAEGCRFDARGLVLTCWGDGGHHQSTSSLFPSLIHAARHCWGVGQPDSSDLPEEIDALFFPSRPAGNGKAICNLGRIDALLPFPNPNQSFLHQAFFADPGTLDRLAEGVTTDLLEEVIDQMEGIPTESVESDIRLSKEMNSWAARRCLGAKHSSQSAAKDLRVELIRLRDEFARIWKKNSRPGGLVDSLERFPVDNI